MIKARLGGRLAMASTLLVFALVGMIVDDRLQLEGRPRIVLWGGLVVLGLLATAIVRAFVRRRMSRPRPAPPPKDRRVDDAFDAAEAKLAGLLARKKARIAEFPAVLVVGLPGSGKTSVILGAEANAELLAGTATTLPGVEEPPSTETANLWFDRRTLIVEAGGQVLDDPDRWSQLLKRLRAAHFKSALSGEAQPPRRIVLSVGCDTLLNADALDVSARARGLRERLMEAGREFGVRLPVYVVFSKLDQVHGFRAFVQNFETDEAAEMLGVTLPVSSDGGWSVDRIRRRLDRLAHSLRLRRSSLLRREETLALRGEMFDFPRELERDGGLFDKAADFLATVCEPRQSELAIAPILRGFYFVGVRPVLVTGGRRDIGHASRAAGSIGGATAVFRPSDLRRAPDAAASRGRRVGQWVFLPRLFPRVILADRTAEASTSLGAGVHLIRRVAFGAAGALGIVLMLGLLLSYTSNRSSSLRVREAVRSVEPVRSEVVSRGDLERLDGLRTQIVRIRRGHGLLTHGWRINRADELLAIARQVYFDRFARVMWNSTFAELTESLRALPTEPDESVGYGTVYADLRAYLVVSDFPQYANDELAEVLLRHYRPDAVDVEGNRELLLRQFSFYADELAYGNPWLVESEPLMVQRTQRLLSEITEVDPFYSAMLQRAGGAGSSVWLGSPPVTTSDSVPAAFTRPGWENVEDQLRNVDLLIQRETFVTGDYTPSEDQLTILADSLQRRYREQYRAHWIALLDGAGVPGFSSVNAAAEQVALMAGGASPMLDLLEQVATNTAVGVPAIDTLFDPVRAFVEAADDADPLWGAYRTHLVDLEGTLSGFASSSPAEQSASGSATASEISSLSADARSIVSALQGYRPVIGSMESLVDAPFERAESIVRRSGQQVVVNSIVGAGRNLCQAFAPLANAYPFRPDGPDADPDAFDEFFNPEGGALRDAIENGALADLLRPEGRFEVEAVPGTTRLTGAFVGFINRALAVSEQWYRIGDRSPGFSIDVSTSSDLAEETAFSNQGRQMIFTRSNRGARPLTWSLFEGGTTEVQVRQADAWTPVVVGGTGPWAFVHLLDRGGPPTEPATGRYLTAIPVSLGGSTGTVYVDITTDGAPVFDSRWYGGLSCPSGNIIG